MLTGEALMSELHLSQQAIAYSSCGPLAKHLERIQKFKNTGDLYSVFKNQLDKVIFVYNAAYADTKDSDKIVVLDKILKNRAYEITSNLHYERYRRRFDMIVYQIFN